MAVISDDARYAIAVAVAAPSTPNCGISTKFSSVFKAADNVTRAEVVQGRDDGVEIAQRLPDEHQGREQHGLLALHVVREQRADRGCSLEQTVVEVVDQFVAAWGHRVEARLESLEVEFHAQSIDRP